MVILGVDPGSRRTGYGAITSVADRAQLIESGTIAPPPSESLEQRLRHIHSAITAVIERLRPEVLAVEDVFHSNNARTALVLGHVRGVILLAGAQAGLDVQAYSPATVKLDVAGFGRADKRQVALMVQRHLGLQGAADPGDPTDALAVALCHAHSCRTLGLVR